MNKTKSRYNAIRKELNKEKLYYYLIQKKMSKSQLAKMYNVSTNFINNLIKKHNINILEERKKYINELNEKIKNKQSKISFNYGNKTQINKKFVN